ncbi:hypothetical protein GE09DRAFT_1066223 [Coniochaeta sp. 2T2.1]|nr:hypothetical protein GE09DRAFT_1066223 [Coniochaeta sp. 2T2.1]
MAALRNIASFLLASAGNVAYAGVPFLRDSLSFVSYEQLAVRSATDPLCQFNPFYCDITATSPNAYHFDYSSLAFNPGLTQGNPATVKFCIGKDCGTSSTVSVVIRGAPDACTTATGATVVITFAGIAGDSYTEEHIYVGSAPPAKTDQFGNFPFTTGIGHYSGNTAAGAPTQYIIPLTDFLKAAGINTPCANGSIHNFVIVTHASVSGPTGGRY